jgi:ribonuclease HI
VDGASRGNPGPAGIGAVFWDDQGKLCAEISLPLGEATNNVAESCALVISLQEALRRGAKQVTVETDSELLVRQVNGDYRVRDKNLQWIHVLIRHLWNGFLKAEIRHIPRSENRMADRLARKAATQAMRSAG